ncbi:hypothetical protein [Polymorphospora sp. NPDC050346]|uniref:hypothetical protein n=1 Tax=Polymorphospora sp. NPDC050346 TaxID=3155780 RepID=UPI0033EA77C2
MRIIHAVDRALRLVLPTTTAAAACEVYSYYEYEYRACPGGQTRWRRTVTIQASCSVTRGPWTQVSGCIQA